MTEYVHVQPHTISASRNKSSITKYINCLPKRKQISYPKRWEGVTTRLLLFLPHPPSALLLPLHLTPQGHLHPLKTVKWGERQVTLRTMTITEICFRTSSSSNSSSSSSVPPSSSFFLAASASRCFRSSSSCCRRQSSTLISQYWVTMVH